VLGAEVAEGKIGNAKGDEKRDYSTTKKGRALPGSSAFNTQFPQQQRIAKRLGRKADIAARVRSVEEEVVLWLVLITGDQKQP
jgi:hypothetical protein